MAIFPRMIGIAGRNGRWLWIGGWASSVEVWAPWIELAFPHQEHAYLAVDSLFSGEHEPNELVGSLVMPDGTLPDVVMAWSLGSLVALGAWNAGFWPEGLGLVAICPVVEFCAPSGPWRPLILNRMIRALGRDRETVLEDFSRLMWPEMPEELASCWRRGSEGISDLVLAQGLERLRDGRLERLRSGNGLVLIEGRDDHVSPRLDAVLGPEALRDFPRFCLDAGHVPFLQDPEGFGRIVSDL